MATITRSERGGKYITAEEYIGTGDDADWGKLNLFRLANAMLGQPHFEPLEREWLEAVEEASRRMIGDVAYHARGGRAAA